MRQMFFKRKLIIFSLCFLSVLATLSGYIYFSFGISNQEKEIVQESCSDELNKFTITKLKLSSLEPTSPPVRARYAIGRYIHIAEYSVKNMQLINPYFPSHSATTYITTYQEDTDLQRRLWEHFLAIAPDDIDKIISKVSFFTDGSRGTVAYIRLLSRGTYKLGIDIVDMANTDQYDITETYLHEIGHLVLFNENQFDDTGRECDTYVPSSGPNTGECSYPDAYILEFYNRYWADIYKEWEDIHLSHTDDTAFFQRYRDRFMNSYAATSIDEDMAETWVYFILAPQPTGDTIPEKKVRFYYEYEESVELREELRANICAYFGVPVEN